MHWTHCAKNHSGLNSTHIYIYIYIAPIIGIVRARSKIPILSNCLSMSHMKCRPRFSACLSLPFYNPTHSRLMPHPFLVELTVNRTHQHSCCLLTSIGFTIRSYSSLKLSYHTKETQIDHIPSVFPLDKVYFLLHAAVNIGLFPRGMFLVLTDI